MRLLLDESISRRAVQPLGEHGHDVLHVGDAGLRGAPDDQVMRLARDQDRILVTADTDFGTMLALTGQTAPAVLLLRAPGRRLQERVRLISEALDQLEGQLDGLLAVVQQDRIRLRDLPIHDPDEPSP